MPLGESLGESQGESLGELLRPMSSRTATKLFQSHPCADSKLRQIEESPLFPKLMLLSTRIVILF
jgi:hypothetical protein